MTRTRRNWPAFRTPIAVFLAVMAPINALMLFLIVTPAPAWVDVSAACVVLLSAHAFVRGYVSRLSIDADGVRLRRVTSTIFLAWHEIRRIGEYAPGRGVGGAEYVYITTRDRVPAGKWDVDERTIQVQARPELLDDLNAALSEAMDD